MFLTFAVLLEWITEEVSDPVRGNGKWDSCSNLQGVDADHLPILKYQDRGKSKKTTHILTLLDFFCKACTRKICNVRSKY